MFFPIDVDGRYRCPRCRGPLRLVLGGSGSLCGVDYATLQCARCGRRYVIYADMNRDGRVHLVSADEWQCLAAEYAARYCRPAPTPRPRRKTLLEYLGG